MMMLGLSRNFPIGAFSGNFSNKLCKKRNCVVWKPFHKYLLNLLYNVIIVLWVLNVGYTDTESAHYLGEKYA